MYKRSEFGLSALRCENAGTYGLGFRVRFRAFGNFGRRVEGLGIKIWGLGSSNVKGFEGAGVRV